MWKDGNCILDQLCYETHKNVLCMNPPFLDDRGFFEGGYLHFFCTPRSSKFPFLVTVGDTLVSITLSMAPCLCPWLAYVHHMTLPLFIFSFLFYFKKI